MPPIQPHQLTFSNPQTRYNATSWKEGNKSRFSRKTQIVKAASRGDIKKLEQLGLSKAEAEEWIQKVQASRSNGTQ